MIRVYDRLNGNGRPVYLETVFIDDALRLANDGVYRTFKGDYTDLTFKVVD